jgi:hypothetical protein
MATRRELKMAVGERYRAAARWERRQILDEFTRVTGYHRKHAMRVLHRPFVARPAQPRRRIYDEAVRQALVLLWEPSDRICGKIPSCRASPARKDTQTLQSIQSTLWPVYSVDCSKTLQTPSWSRREELLGLRSSAKPDPLLVIRRQSRQG